MTSRSRNILIQLFLVFLVAYSALVAIYYNATHDYAIAEAEKLIESELLTHRAMHSYIEDIQKPEIYRLKDEGKLYREYFSPKVLSFTFAARGVKEFLNQERAKVDRPKIYFKLAAYNPRNPINSADSEELELLKRMNRDEIEEFKQIRDFEGQPHLYYAIPINPNKKSCMRCHSDPAIAPAELVEMYGDKAGFYEEIGDIRAMISIRVPLEQQFAESDQIFYGLSGITLGTLAAIYLLIIYFFRTIDHKQQQLITANIELNRLSVTDPLTGLHNRLRFNEDIERELAESERYDSPLTLLMLDLDHFKQLNDTLGHQAGDAALKHAAAIFKRATRPSDICARWGGEEFVIAAPQTDLTGATALAEKLRETLSSSPFTAGETLTVSIGVTERISGEPLEQMMARVDKALYLAKANGRNRVEAISGD